MADTGLTFDVVIPVYEPDRKLKIVLERLKKQRIKPEKIVLMVTMETGDDEKEAADKLKEALMDDISGPEVHFIKKEEFDHGGTRNIGISFCAGDIVICMTQDAVPENSRLTEKLLEPFYETSDVLISYARQIPARNSSEIEKYTRSFNYPEESCIKRKEDIDRLGIKTFFASNVCAAYRRGIFESRGGFPDKTIFNEDMIFAGLAVKDGYAIAYAADAKVIHSHNLSGRQQFHRNFDLAVSQVQHPEVFKDISSESEGVQFVKDMIRHLSASGKAYLVPCAVWNSGCRYLGYLVGKHYKALPGKLVRACSMNKGYWGM